MSTLDTAMWLYQAHTTIVNHYSHTKKHRAHWSPILVRHAHIAIHRTPANSYQKHQHNLNKKASLNIRLSVWYTQTRWGPVTNATAFTSLQSHCIHCHCQRYTNHSQFLLLASQNKLMPMHLATKFNFFVCRVPSMGYAVNMCSVCVLVLLYSIFNIDQLDHTVQCLLFLFIVIFFFGSILFHATSTSR